MNHGCRLGYKAFKMVDARNGLKSVEFSCFLAFVLRFCLIAYGEWQDKNMVVKYTDIDYVVFTDAARHVLEGNSPYLRPTYRYTPILSLLLTPNISLHFCFGKVLFVLFDVLTGYLLYKILCVRGCSDHRAVIFSWMWLFNPVAFAVSTRGNAESIMAALVLATVYFVLINKITVAAIFFAVSVHFKIFPIIYSLPFVLLVGNDLHHSSKADGDRIQMRPRCYDFLFRSVEIILHPERVKFSLISAMTFLGITGAMYGRCKETTFDFILVDV